MLEQSMILWILIEFAKYLLQEVLETLFGQILIKLMDGCWEVEELVGFLEVGLLLNLTSITG